MFGEGGHPVAVPWVLPALDDPRVDRVEEGAETLEIVVGRFGRSSANRAGQASSAALR